LGREKADKVARILEVILKAIEEKVKGQKPILKAEIKEGLTKELVTKAELQIVKLELEKKIDRLEVYLKVLIGLVILGLMLLNPAFLDLIKSIFSSK
ncbi:MAG: hypothetical protein WKI50_00600, partial [Aquificaceae bacterium]